MSATIARMAAFDVPLPRIAFPEPGWLDRMRAYLASAPRHMWIGKIRPPSGGLAACEAALGTRMPEELDVLYGECDGMEIGFVTLLPLARVIEDTRWVRGEIAPEEWDGCIPSDVPRSVLVVFAEDQSENKYAYRLDAVDRRVVYVSHDPPQAEHRFTSLSTFLDACSARAYALAMWNKVETEHGYAPEFLGWFAAARELEVRIDPHLLRTIDD
jgi:hypothetical protein